MTEKKWVLEWSAKCNGFHIQLLESALANNQLRFMQGKSVDWIVLMVGPKDACHAMADGQRQRLITREHKEAA